MSRTKNCAHCQKIVVVAFRIRISPNKDWVFVCTDCCKKAGGLPGYQYGGTWKGLKKEDR